MLSGRYRSLAQTSLDHPPARSSGTEWRCLKSRPMACPPRCVASANASRVSRSRLARDTARFFPKLHVGSHVPTAHQFPRAAPGPRSAPFFERPCHGHRSRCSRVPTRHEFSRLFFRRGSHALSKARITSNIPAVIDVGARPKCAKKLALATSINVVSE
jgi:hypothetical protein